MSPNPNEFEEVRRLIALKRYEQPPPRFFNEFPSSVIARIRAGERSRTESSGLLARLWAAFEAKPLWAGVAGFAACALVVVGFVASEGERPIADIPQAPGDTASFLAEPSTPAPARQATLVSFGSMSGVPVSQPQVSLFDQVRNAQQRQTWQYTSSQGR
jgi:hypothetical protein